MRQGLRLVIVATLAAAAGLAVPLPDASALRSILATDASDGVETPAASFATAPPAASKQIAAASAAQPQAVVPESAAAVKLSFAPIVKRVAPAVVNVYATARVQVRSPFEGDPFFERFFGRGSPFGTPRQRERTSLGSGVIVDAAGVVVTNNHVIGNATEVKVALADGREFQADILLRDERSDLAVLKIQNVGEAFPALVIGDSDGLEVGDLVLAVGNPFAVGQTVTSGIVSAVARTNLGINDSGFFVQTDAAINPGNSGGALVNMDGALIGVNTAIYSRSGGSIGIGFAIPSDMVRTVVAQALAGSSSVARAWIGVICQNITPDIAASLGISKPQGALISHISDGSPGHQIGLKVGDLILKADDHEVSDVTAFDYRLAVVGIGNPLKLHIWRDGVTMVLTAVPQAEPQLDEADLTLLGGRSPLTGAVVADLSPTLVERMRLRNVRNGAVIVDIEPLSPAERMGFRPGDVVIGAQGEDVETATQLADLVEVGSRMWRISFNRGGRISRIVIGG